MAQTTAAQQSFIAKYIVLAAMGGICIAYIIHPIDLTGILPIIGMLAAFAGLNTYLGIKQQAESNGEAAAEK